MPPVSQAQRRFFRWAAAHPKESGVSRKVSAEFNDADKGGKLPEQVEGGKPRRKRSRGSGFYDHPRSPGRG